jgi:hypothetical protein
MRMSRFPMWVVMTAGYLLGGRAFSYVGISPLFVGEAYLLVQVLWNRHNWIGRFVGSVLRPDLLSMAIFLHLLWGLIEIIRSLFLGRALVEVLRTAAFNYYPIYVVIGVMIGKEITMQTYIKSWKLIVILATVYVLVDPILSLGDSWGIGPAMPPVITLAMIALWRHFEKWKTRYILLAVTIFPVFFRGAHGHRSWMLGLVVGLIAIAIAKPERLVRWIIITLTATVVLLIVGPLIPGPEGTAPPLDPVVQLGRAVSGNAPDLAVRIVKWRGYPTEAESIRSDAGTAEWRKAIWSGAIRSMNTFPLQMLGRGEGVSIGDLTPDGQDIHTPHNILIYSLLYTGWVGLIIFSLLLVALFREAYRLTNPDLRALSLAIILAVTEMTISGNLLETPFGAIPFYLICGVAFGLGRRKATPGVRPIRRAYQFMPESLWAQPTWQPDLHANIER